jgi:hypothetical protein
MNLVLGDAEEFRTVRLATFTLSLCLGSERESEMATVFCFLFVA